MAAALAAAAPAPAPAQAESGITLYPPEFFADAQPATAQDMINRIPGFTFENGDNNVRGFGAAAGNVLIDGERPTSKSENLDGVLRRIPASRVERIEVIRGGAPGIDMQGKTVIANVIRKTGAATTGLMQVQNTFVYDGRHQPAWRLEWVRKWLERQLEASVNYGGFTEDQAGDGPRIRVAPNGTALISSRNHVEGTFRNLTGTLVYEQEVGGGDLRLDARMQSFTQINDEETRLTVPSLSSEFSRSKNLNDQNEAGVRYSRDVGQRWSLEGVFLQQIRHNRNRSWLYTGTSETFFFNNRRVGESVGRFVAIYRLSDALSFQTGGEGALNWLNGRTRFTLNNAPVGLPNANVRVEEKRGEVFGLVTWKPSTTFGMEGGMRIEASRLTATGDVTLEKSLKFFKPRVVATWSPNRNNQIRLRLEQEVGQLNFDDFVASSSLAQGFVSAGNPDLDPQRALVAEAVYEGRFWREGALVVSFKHSELKDVIDRAPIFGPTGVFDAPANIGKGKRDDLTVNFTLPTDRFGIGGGLLKLRLTRRWSEVVDPTTGEVRSFANQRPVDWGINFSQDLPRWRANWGFDYAPAWKQTSYRWNEVSTSKASEVLQIYGEVRPRQDLNLRVEMQHSLGRNVERIRQVYGATGRLGPLAYTDVRQLEFGRLYQVRIRKTFG